MELHGLSNVQNEIYERACKTLQLNEAVDYQSVKRNYLQLSRLYHQALKSPFDVAKQSALEELQNIEEAYRYLFPMPQGEN